MSGSLSFKRGGAAVLGNLVAADGASGGFVQDAQLDSDGTMAANSSTRVPAQSAVVTYVAAAISALRNGVSAAYDTLAEIATDLATRALQATTISAAGLATGGGSLAANRTITVPAATATEVRAQSSSTAALTPASYAQVGTFKGHLNGVNQGSVAPTTHTKVALSAETFDVGSWFDTSQNRWTPSAGRVYLHGRVRMSTNILSGQDAYISIYKNGSALEQKYYLSQVAGIIDMEVFCEDTANGTDYYELYCYAAGAGDKTIAGSSVVTYLYGCQL